MGPDLRVEQLPAGVLADERPEGAAVCVLDPFDVKEGWFVLELVNVKTKCYPSGVDADPGLFTMRLSDASIFDSFTPA